MQPLVTVEMCPATRPATAGALEPVGARSLGLDSYYYWSCPDCKELYPTVDGAVKCNGRMIGACPWCRPNSAPWTNGRGL